ncbi:uncharacterized protein LOC119178211 isoform X3 [Rhipicephalus microplus]|uniref:uncharacterized protein LOC119178211 isoform X3 n=1 Tax=Rhipicephalus microplus TaxID=6941 RepID=UPI001887156D|nr:uncharacterized protein LOC119178211 isoform X1 [Rhipicephalus microplus]
MESRRRCWIGHEHQSSYSPKSCVSNLTSNEWCRCRHDAHQGDFFRAHTLLLIVQVFLLAIAGVPTSCNVCLGPSATNASSDTRPQSRSTFTPGMLDTPLQDLRMSVMSCTMDSIKALPQNYYTSGHGEAAATMPLTKEFVLAVQIGTFLLLIPAGHEEAGKPTTAWTANLGRDKARHVQHAPVGLDGRPYKLDPLGSATYCADAIFSAPSVPHSTTTTLDINTAPQATAINGHGGTRSMQSANPFLYVVQLFLVLGYECLDFVSAYRGPTCFSMLDLPCRLPASLGCPQQYRHLWCGSRYHENLYPEFISRIYSQPKLADYPFQV